MATLKFFSLGSKVEPCFPPGIITNSKSRPARLKRRASLVVSVRNISNSDSSIIVGGNFASNSELDLPGNNKGSFFWFSKSDAPGSAPQSLQISGDTCSRSYNWSRSTNGSMYIYIYIYIHVCVYMYICIYVYVYTCMYI